MFVYMYVQSIYYMQNNNININFTMYIYQTNLHIVIEHIRRQRTRISFLRTNIGSILRLLKQFETFVKVTTYKEKFEMA